MAAPASVTIKNLTGKFTMDKTKSSPTEPVLNTQGVSWTTRKAIGIATITLTITQSVDEKGITHIKVSQTGPAGISGTDEVRHLDNELHEHKDHVFGSVKGRSQWITLDNVDKPLADNYESTPEEVKFLKEGWIEDESENGGPNGERHIDSFVRNESRGWTARQIWGFAIIDGQRHYVRRVVVKKDKTVHLVKLIYNYVS